MTTTATVGSRAAAHRAPLALVVTSLVRQRTLIGQLTRRNVVGRYRGSLVGIAWSVVLPLLMLAVYTFVFGVIFNRRWGDAEQGTLDFAIVLYAGLILHRFFTECLNQSPGLIVGSRQLVKRVVFPLEILAWVTVCTALVNTAISIGVLMFITLVFKHSLPWTLIFLPAALLPLALVALGAVWWLSSTAVFIRDVGQLVSVIGPVLLFMSPIFYPVDALPVAMQPYLYLNPLTLPIEELRGALIFGDLPRWDRLAVYSVVAVGCAWLGLAWFQKTRRGFADVV